MADSNLDVAEMVIRHSTRYQQMTQEERRVIDNRIAEFMNDEESDNDEDDVAFDVEVEDNDDLTYQPNLDVDESDAETEPHVEINEELDEDDEDELETAPATTETSDSYFTSKNGTKWSKVEPPNTRIRAHNVVDYTRRKPGPVKDTYDPYTIFRTFITEVYYHTGNQSKSQGSNNCMEFGKSYEEKGMENNHSKRVRCIFGYRFVCWAV